MPETTGTPSPAGSSPAASPSGPDTTVVGRPSLDTAKAWMPIVVGLISLVVISLGFMHTIDKDVDQKIRDEKAPEVDTEAPKSATKGACTEIDLRHASTWKEPLDVKPRELEGPKVKVLNR